jgi:hypothetical protein
MASQHLLVPASVIVALRRACTALPEVVEEAAWTGTRWCIRKKAFAHVLMLDAGWPPAYARVAGTDGPACLLTFRSALPALDLYAFSEPPFFRPGWWPDIAGMQLDDSTDWAEVTDLVTASYRLLAPRKLAAQVDRP